MTTRYDRSPWIDRFPKSRVPSYPRHCEPFTTNVVIIGGGLTGCTTAYALAAAGIKAVLLEGGSIGRGSTARAAGWISDDPGVPFDEVEKLLGLRAARYAFQSWHRAALDFIALIRRLDIKCHLEQHGSISLAVTTEQAARLKRDQKARRDAGLDTPALSSRTIASETAIAAVAGIRGRDGATLDPYRACVGLAAAAVERGVRIFERSPVRKIKFGRKNAEVFTAAGAIRTDRIVVATGMATAPLFKSLARHFWFRTTYLALTEPLPAKIRNRLGQRASVVRDGANPSHVIGWVDDERLLVMGADTETPPERQRDKVVVQRTGQLMYEMSTLYPDVSGVMPAYGWHADYARTLEGLPYIGPHRNFPHHLFAFGDSSRSITGAYLASRVLVRYIRDELESGDQVFGFTR